MWFPLAFLTSVRILVDCFVYRGNDVSSCLPLMDVEVNNFTSGVGGGKTLAVISCNNVLSNAGVKHMIYFAISLFPINVVAVGIQPLFFQLVRSGFQQFVDYIGNRLHRGRKYKSRVILPGHLFPVVNIITRQKEEYISNIALKSREVIFVA